MEDKGSFKQAIKFITKQRQYITDDCRRNEVLARLYENNNQKPKAMECHEQLLQLNTCNAQYYKNILKSHGTNLDKPDELVEKMKEYEEALPKSNTHVRLLIDHIPAGEMFKQKFIKYARPMIIKGVPSMINDLKTMYGDEAKVKIIGETIKSMSECMEKSMCLEEKDVVSHQRMPPGEGD